MFRKNQRHLQPALFSDLDNLSPKARARLEASWAGVFRREFYGRLDESPFAGLYSDTPSRPNIPVNVLVSLEALKSGFGWSDEEMHDAFLFDLQVRYALGYDNVGEGDFDLRTVYNFRRRVCDHMRDSGENLIEWAFEQITDEQVLAFQLKTGRLRMDSTQIASNIQRMARVQLLVEVLQRVHRMLQDADRAHYADAFAPYLKGSSGQYLYHLKGEDTGPHLQRIGELMHRLVNELAPAYVSHDTYQTLQRVFHEQFILSEPAPQSEADDAEGHDPPGDPATDDGPVTTSSSEDQSAAKRGLAVALVETTPVQVSSPFTPVVQAKRGQDISPTSLRSPDDPEATYRKKGQQAYEGYVTNLTETCDPRNPFQLIVKVQSAPNITEDTTLLEEALPELKARTDVHTLYNDAGFCGLEVDKLLHKLKVEQVPTALRGRVPHPSLTSLTDCEIRLDVNGQPVKLVCPHGYTALVTPGRKVGRFIARWADAPCPECRFSKHHAGGKASAKTCIRFSQVDLNRALRRQRMQAYHLGKKSLRAAVEATVGAVKRPFNNDKAPVRGTIRLGQMMIGSAIMVNIRRIQRYKLEKRKTIQSEQSSSLNEDKGHTNVSPSTRSFLSLVRTRLQRFPLPIRSARATLVFGF
jgi:hypothetical protein